jgi:general secretion pathway protein H
VVSLPSVQADALLSPRVTGVGRVRAWQARRQQVGITLIELLIAIALIALLTGGVASGMGAFGSTRLRTSATMILSGIRVAMTQANTTGYPTRLVFDLDQRTVHLEQANSRMLRKMDDESKEDPSAGAAAATDAEREAATAAKAILEGPHEPPPEFVPTAAFNTKDGTGKGPRSLEPEIRFKSVQTEHDSEPRSEGRAYLYFWPGGGTEKAVIVLTRPGQPDGSSIVVSALTGRAAIVRGTVEYDKPEVGVDFGEREVD